MIKEVRHFELEQGTPSQSDIQEAIDLAKKLNCRICLSWKGPGYQWHGDTYSVTVGEDSVAWAVFDELPKSYGL